MLLGFVTPPPDSCLEFRVRQWCLSLLSVTFQKGGVDCCDFFNEVFAQGAG